MAQPFDLPNLGIAIASAITSEDGSGARVAWQRSGGGAASHTSQIGTQGGAATLFGDFEVREGETAIIAEVFYDFEPFLSEQGVKLPDALPAGPSSPASRHAGGDWSGLSSRVTRLRPP